MDSWLCMPRHTVCTYRCACNLNFKILVLSVNLPRAHDWDGCIGCCSKIGHKLCTQPLHEQAMMDHSINIKCSYTVALRLLPVLCSNQDGFCRAAETSGGLAWRSLSHQKEHHRIAMFDIDTGLHWHLPQTKWDNAMKFLKLSRATVAVNSGLHTATTPPCFCPFENFQNCCQLNNLSGIQSSCCADAQNLQHRMLRPTRSVGCQQISPILVMHQSVATLDLLFCPLPSPAFIKPSSLM